MSQESFRAFLVWITLLSCLTMGESTNIQRIAFVRDSNPVKRKCSSAEHENLSKPIVLMRLTKTPLNELNFETQGDEEDEYSYDEAGDLQNEITNGQGGQYSYTLIELNKSQIKNLLNSGKLKLIESQNLNQAKVGIQLYNQNSNDLTDNENDDLNNENDNFDDENESFEFENGNFNDADIDLDDEEGRSRRRPWRRVRRIVRRQLRPRRYLKKIVRRVG